jgi:acetyltransferase-like isoleucine patch superfamily enzyme
MFFYYKALYVKGVRFEGLPRYIDYSSYLDPAGGLSIGDNVVISRNVIILTHDYSYTVGLISINKKPPTDIAILSSVKIGSNCFIGAGTIILPGARIGSNVIIGAGSLVKGILPDNVVVAGSPAKCISDIREWITNKQLHVDDLELLVDEK